LTKASALSTSSKYIGKKAIIKAHTKHLLASLSYFVILNFVYSIQTHLTTEGNDVPMDHHRTPLFSALLQHAEQNPIQFHIPGHKKGVGMDPEFRAFIGDNALSIDLINIAPLDDLHQPTGVIEEAQRMAADAFNADYTFFSVQGTSGAIMTMIMSVCTEGDKIIVPRNVHKSVMSAILRCQACFHFTSQ
jgi:arginine/lysine/ornithine decarboxylase